MAEDDVGDYSGLWDDISEGLKWKPILPMLARIREASSNGAKLKAAREAAAFGLKTAMGRDPYKMRGFLVLCLAIDLYERDERVKALIDEVL